jgi:hypothetical protein
LPEILSFFLFSFFLSFFHTQTQWVGLLWSKDRPIAESTSKLGKESGEWY